MRKFILLFVLLILTACATGLSSKDQAMLSNKFEAKRIEIENQAIDGKITWVGATNQLKNIRLKIASELNSTNIESNWAFTPDDQEYYLYQEALAEKLDSKQITYREFNAARIQKFNQLRARRQSLDNQQELIEISQRMEQSQTRQGNQNTQQECLYNPATQAYQVCYHLTAGGQCAHFGSPCN